MQDTLNLGLSTYRTVTPLSKYFLIHAMIIGQAMYKMFKKVNGRSCMNLGHETSVVFMIKQTDASAVSMMRTAREKIVGWYSTGPKLKEADLDINSLMAKYTDGSADPVLVICEVEVSD